MKFDKKLFDPLSISMLNKRPCASNKSTMLGSERRVLTARNLFDDIFATIPEHLSLFSTREDLNYLEPVDEQVRGAAGDEEDGEAENQADWMMTAPALQSAPPTAGNELLLELNEDDAAVKEAKNFYSDAVVQAKPRPQAATKGAAQAPSKQAPQQQQQQQRRQDNMSAEEQLRLMPPGTDDVHKGVVVLFNHLKGFGFISPVVGGPDVYVTRESISLQYSRRLLTGDAHEQQGAEGETVTEPIAKAQQHDEATVRYARLLTENTKPFLLTGENVEFLVSINANGGGGGGDRRRLRAISVTGPNRGPIQIEKSLYQLQTDRRGPPSLRVKGVVRNVSREQERGYIRPSDGAGHDAVFFCDTVVWDPSVSVGDRLLREGTVVEYTVIGKEKNGKPRAGLVTAEGGIPLVPSKAPAANSGATKDSDEMDDDGTLLRKRPRNDGPGDAAAPQPQQMLLLDDDAYGGGW